MRKTTPPLILASTSPFRRELLTRLGLEFETFAPEIDETSRPGEDATSLVERLSIRKAKAARAHFDNALVIGSDQVSINNDKILGKPQDHQQAVEQLRQASGQRIRFLTGLCLYNIREDRYQVHVEPFDVVFRKLSTQQIENYLRAEQPYNCAGSFKSEGLGITLFESMQGDDPNSLIGLPLIRLTTMLAEEGIEVLSD
ncbi:MAG: septum formation inhibitor Maf [Gammaproteobacteria bacterium]|nr:MAG: septum formation inhibitor Maf [Gammaproteobacteria bacterium]